MNLSVSSFATVPLVDIREAGVVRYAAAALPRARQLRDECIAWLPRAAGSALPAMDAVTRRWLRRSSSPYVGEIEQIASTVGLPGIWFLNGCFQWGCTSLAREQQGVPWLVRTLDWPFPGLGRRLEVVRMAGTEGAFDSVTWPGYAGVLTACAPGRFAAAINQAPLYRRWRRPWLRPVDLSLNAVRTWRIRFIPPDHLLRRVFESCRDFAEARHRLETTPIARPVIFSLVGCQQGERCTIERTETDFSTDTDNTCAANDWLQARPQWEARTRADLMFKRTYEETAASSRERRAALLAWPVAFSGRFDWVVAPVLNPYTRLAVEMCPAKGILHAAGFEGASAGELPQPVARTVDEAMFSEA